MEISTIKSGENKTISTIIFTYNLVFNKQSKQQFEDPNLNDSDYNSVMQLCFIIPLAWPISGPD